MDVAITSPHIPICKNDNTNKIIILIIDPIIVAFIALTDPFIDCIALVSGV